MAIKGINGLVKSLNSLNEYNGDMHFEADPAGLYIIFNDYLFAIPAIDMPKGYYHNKKNGITNKHNTEDGLYEAYPLYSTLDQKFDFED